VFGLSQGNPPRGVAVWYSLVDAVALGGGPLLSRGMKNISEWLTSRDYYPERVGKLSSLLGFRAHVREDLQVQMRLTAQAIRTSFKSLWHNPPHCFRTYPTDHSSLWTCRHVHN
jgi:hypothetical protein